MLLQFNERLNHELMALYPAPKVKVTAPGNTAERRFASWIGGSILASLGTFHQVRSSIAFPLQLLNNSFDEGMGRVLRGITTQWRMGKSRAEMLTYRQFRCGYPKKNTMSMGRGLWRSDANEGNERNDVLSFFLIQRPIFDSIRPRWVGLIQAGKKFFVGGGTFEIRKARY